ncbi:MAG: type II toxin-antitoxin system VapC family toxin [Candidatus Rokubacteria bacterium]|nr:type II toxin-antitoxin system VapC family toxin [Candidatus Rokubacteria bacterium]MBI3824387.1 type II toxin-antitoxin system VapC family toxin [Candidatus Rokubacteria bacterium]
MRFWDTSALVAIVVSEAATSRVRRWMAEDGVVVVWTLTRVEILSALARRRRAAPRAAARYLVARRELMDAWERWTEIAAVDLVRGHAERLVEGYPLRAADALHLGAALVASDGDPGSLEFVTLDEAQASAAEREGFRVLGP